MSDQTIAAYNLSERVAHYDSDMKLMHPNRFKMVEVALEVLPFPLDSPLLALDLGTGTGFFADAVLTRYPCSRVLAVDGAPVMMNLARARMGKLAERVEFLTGDFRNLRQLLGSRKGQVVFSSYALHHLNRQEKREVVKGALDFLEPGGWFLNADLVIASSPVIERRIQEIRVNGIVARAAGRDPRFAAAEATRNFLNELELKDQDKPLSLNEDLRILEEAGLVHTSVFWMEFREAVTGGVKS
jgi:tRNA (cmo5U34)-methyltransferase